MFVSRSWSDIRILLFFVLNLLAINWFVGLENNKIGAQAMWRLSIPVSFSTYVWLWPPLLSFLGWKADSFYIIESGEVSILIKSKVSLCVMMWVVPGRYRCQLYAQNVTVYFNSVKCVSCARIIIDMWDYVTDRDQCLSLIDKDLVYISFFVALPLLCN